jgi:hypothetical protein
MEAVFRPGIVRIFSGGFLSTSYTFRQELAVNHRKNSGRNAASTKSSELPGTGRFRAELFDLSIYPNEVSNFFVTLILQHHKIATSIKAILYSSTIEKYLISKR